MGRKQESTNRQKHGIAFETAIQVFMDQNAIMRYNRDIAGEQRWQTIGCLDGTSPVVVVIHTMMDDGDGAPIRIISARKATPTERRLYEKHQKDN